MRHLPKIAEACTVLLNSILVPTRAPIKANTVLRRFPAGVRNKRSASQIFQARHPKSAIELASQPSCHANVVRMHMSDQNPGYFTLIESAGEQLSPRCGGVVRL